MRLFSCFYTSLSSIVCLCAGMNDSLESPFGLTFSSTAVIASRFNASGSIELIRQPATPAYLEYYNDAVRTYVSSVDITYNMDEVASMFREAITPVTEKLNKQLGQQPKYSALFLPSVFHYTMRNAAVEVLFGDEPLKRPIVSGTSQKAVCYGFGFLDGKYLNRRPEECNDAGSVNLVLVLEYEKEYLHVWIAEVDFEYGVYYTDQKSICEQCGELFRNDIGASAYGERLNKFLNDFLENKVFQTHRRDSVRAIVLAGDASEQEMAELGETACRAVGTESVRVMSEIDPSEAVAYGAAVLARKTHQSPEKFKIDAPSGDVRHDEL